jgi:cysteine desulfurase/selenocysteine lyase
LPHQGLVRVSFGLYNTCSEVDRLIELLDNVIRNKASYLKKWQM